MSILKKIITDKNITYYLFGLEIYKVVIKKSPIVFKQNVKQEIVTIQSLPIAYSFFMLNFPCEHRIRKRCAVVSIMPPENSGIAIGCFYNFLNNKYPFDIFTNCKCNKTFFKMIASFKKNGNTQLYDISSFYAFNNLYDYEKIIILVGNSNHHFYIWDFLNSLKEYNLLKKVYLYCHDILLYNICSVGRNKNFVEYFDEIKRLYPKLHSISLPDNCNEMWKVWSFLLKLDIYSIRFFTDFGIKNFIVNSLYAKQMLQNDLQSGIAANIFVLFNPFVKSFIQTENINSFQEIKKKNQILIGHFGVPSERKGLGLLLKAIEILNKNSEIKYKLVLAGWGVNDYLKEKRKDYIIAYDSLNNEHLDQLMQVIDIAVQLRVSSTGESSGVIPLLLLLRKKIITSPVGPFKEYKFVTFFDGNKPEDLALMIRRELKSTLDISSLNEYLKELSAEVFQEKLYNLE